MRFRDGDEMLGLADLNGDNNDDILWRDETGFTFASLFGNPDTIQVIGDRDGDTLLDIQDFDGDGNDDLLWQDQSGGTWIASAGDQSNLTWFGDRSGEELLSYDPDNFSIIG